MEAYTGFLTIHDGGSEQADVLDTLNGTMNDIKMSTPRNQLFLLLQLNGNKASMRLNATVSKSKQFD